MKLLILLLISSFSWSAVIPTKLESDRFFAIINHHGVEGHFLLDTGGNSGIYPEYLWYWELNKGPGPFDIFPQDNLQEKIRVLGNDEETLMIRKVVRDGLLGHGWFSGRIWSLEYPQKRLSLLAKETQKGTKLPLFFKGGNFFYPRMEIEIEGETLQVLFDTGATSFFSLKARQELKLDSAFAASSFIRASVFEKWRKLHPAWKVIEAGDRMGNQPLIQVPRVKVAGHFVGPVWFARRNNESYDVMMAQLMDCKCDGAIGGNVLKNFKQIILNYPAKSATFIK